MHRLSIALFLALCFSMQGETLKSYNKYFNDYCIECHGPQKSKAKLRLDQLTWNTADSDALEIWQEVIDLLEEGEMPPEDEKQPSKEVTAALIKDIKLRFQNVGATAKVILRRLNKQQYSNTVRDLLKVNSSQINPTAAFPEDETIDGFNNNSDAQMMSDFLLAQALKTSRKIVDHGTFPEARPAVKKYKMGDSPSSSSNSKKKKKGGETYFWGKGGNLMEDGSLELFLNDEKEPGDTRGQSMISSYNGVPHSGYYDFTFDLASLGRGSRKEIFKEPFMPTFQTYHPEDLHRLEIYLISSAKRGKDTRGLPRTLIENIDLADNKRQTIKRRFWLNKGWRVQIAFGNAPSGGSNFYYYRLVGKERPENPKKDRKISQEIKEFGKKIPGLMRDLIKKENLPRIKVYDASREGPFYHTWPPQSHQRIYGNKGESNASILGKFASRAFRRPLKKGELAPFLKLAANSEEGIRTAIEAILCSADFLYFVEENEGLLNHYAIANRLSYLLWNTMPDDKLFQLAAQKKLHDKSFLKKLVLEMLNDPRSDEFVKNFNWAWLKLQNTVEMAPDSSKFFDFKRYRIAPSMVKETNLFFRHILDNNLSLKTFIDTDFTYVNSDLARRYGIKGVNTTATFKKVKLDAQSNRGGLLTQTSVLTASANGVDTSPVIRGIWILENLLGIHPPPPPDDVEIPEIDLRGKFTLKELYAKHRNNQNCNSCHKKIDPLGFALENYNATGLWREQYAGGTAIDSGGKMPDGTPFKGVSGLKENMNKRIDLFNRSLTGKLLTYATGRQMKATDRLVIDELVTKINTKDLGLKDLLLEIVTSDIFMHK